MSVRPWNLPTYRLKEQYLLLVGLRLTEGESNEDAQTYASVVGDRGPRGATRAGKGASTGRFARLLGRCYKHNRGTAGFDVHASDRENEDRELPLRRVRPVSSRRRNVCG